MSQVSDSFPFKWINKKWKEGFYVTCMATSHTRWAVVMSRNAGFIDQAGTGYRFRALHCPQTKRLPLLPPRYKCRARALRPNKLLGTANRHNGYQQYSAGYTPYQYTLHPTLRTRASQAFENLMPLASCGPSCGR